MRHCFSASRTCAFVAAVAVVWIVGCDQSLFEQFLSNDPVSFKSPSGTLSVRDDQTLPIEYRVRVDHDMTAHIELDRDTTPGNGNETPLADDQVFQSPGGTVKLNLTAGEFPYGSYYIRVTLTDDAGSSSFSTEPVHIVPLVENGSDDNAEGLDVLPQVRGLRMLHSSGNPGKINERVPFAATWSKVDTKDNLSPIYISPIQIDKPITLSKMQFYVHSRHPEPSAKQLQIYSGTTESSEGTLIQSIDVFMGSSDGGGWNLVNIDPPVTLPAGAYGVSFHGEEECDENWGGNSGGGSGFALLSPVQGAPFAPVTESDLGFSPNFSMRILGTTANDGDATDTTLAPQRVSMGAGVGDNNPTPPAVDTFDDQTHESNTDCDEGEDELGASTPIHVEWQKIGETDIADDADHGADGK